MSTQDNSIEQGYTPLPLRAHTILGICEAIGEDFGFNPTFLRVPLAASVIVSPLWAFVAYFALGGAVLLSRLLCPNAQPASEAVTVEQPTPGEKEGVERELPRAA